MYVKVRVDDEKCIGCKLCIFACPDPNVLWYTDNKKISVNEGRCKGCGLCVANCPKNALSID